MVELYSDATGYIKEGRGYEKLPYGDHYMHIVSTEVVDVKGVNKFRFKLEVTRGELKGRSDSLFLSYWGPSETAKSIAVETIKDIQKAIGKDSITDSAELQFREFLVTYQQQKDKPEYSQYVDFRSARNPLPVGTKSADIPFETGPTQAPTSGHASPQPSQTSAPGKRVAPWENANGAS